MKTTVNQISPVEYDLEIAAEAGDLESEIRNAIRQQRAQTQLKGFRPGKVPLNLVKRMHGKALAYGVAEQKVQEIFREEILSKDEFEVIGQPKLTELDYEMDGDLKAVIRFGVRPEVELVDLSGEKLSRLDRKVTDEDVDDQIERIRRSHSDLVPVEDESITDQFQVIVDLQRVDEESNTPIIGEKEEDVTFFLDDERLNDELRNGLLGKTAGESFLVDLPHGDGSQAHTHRYRVTIKETKRRELPELDDAFVGEVSKDQFVSVEELRDDLRNSLEEAWQQRSQELLDGRIVERMLELHPVPVPESAVDVYLDSFVEDIKGRNEGKLPAGFDDQAFREANRSEAERQARWMVIRDALIEKDDLEVSDDAIQEFFEKAAADNDQLSPELLRQYYESMNMLERVKQQILSRMVFDRLAERFEIVPKDMEAYEEEVGAYSDSPDVGAGGTTLAEAL